MYLHVPAAWVAYLAFGVTALASALWLWPRTRSLGVGPRRRRVGRARRDLHRRSRSCSARCGAGRCGASGGRGTPASSRPPCSSSSTSATSRCAASRPRPDARAKRCAIAALIAFVDVPIVHFSVTWWRTLHQEAHRLQPRARREDPRRRWRSRSGSACSRSRSLYVYLLDRRYRLAGARGGPRGARGRAGDRRAGRGAARRRRAGAWSTVDERRRSTSSPAGCSPASCSAGTGSGSCGAPSAPSGRRRHASDDGRVATRRAAAETAGAKRRGRYIVAVGGCVVAVVAIVVLAVVLSRTSCTSAPSRRRSTTGESERRRRGSASPARSCPASSTRRANGVRFESPTARTTVDGRPRRRPARPVQGRRAGRVRGPLGVDGADAPFDSDRILIRHGTDYEPPKVDTERRRDRELREGLARVRGARARCRRGGRRHQRARSPGCGCATRCLLRVRAPLRVRACSSRRSPRPGVMEWALISHDFSIRYVAENNARGTPLLYTITGLWAALEGSILLWGADPRRLPRVRGVQVPRTARPTRSSRGRDASPASSSRCSSSR